MCAKDQLPIHEFVKLGSLFQIFTCLILFVVEFCDWWQNSWNTGEQDKPSTLGSGFRQRRGGGGGRTGWTLLYLPLEVWCTSRLFYCLYLQFFSSRLFTECTYSSLLLDFVYFQTFYRMYLQIFTSRFCVLNNFLLSVVTFLYFQTFYVSFLFNSDFQDLFFSWIFRFVFL